MGRRSAVRDVRSLAHVPRHTGCMLYGLNDIVMQFDSLHYGYFKVESIAAGSMWCQVGKLCVL